MFVASKYKKGDLGTKNLSILNKALLGKWSWSFVSERKPLGKWLIIGKYRQEDAWVVGIWDGS